MNPKDDISSVTVVGVWAEVKYSAGWNDREDVRKTVTAERKREFSIMWGFESVRDVSTTERW